MTLTELIAEVYIITNRPDLTAETLSAIRSATLKAHRSDYYYKDLFETGVTFTSSEYHQYIEYRTLIPLWRSLSYLRSYDGLALPAPGAPERFFEIVTPGLTLDSYSVNRENICYVAGEVIQIRSCNKFQYALLGCYVNPAVGITDGTFVSWIALDFPWAIIHLAAGNVFRAIGKLDEAAAQRDLANIELLELGQSNIIAQGY